MTKVKVKSGICGFETKIKAELLKSELVEIDVYSDCPSVNEISDSIPLIDPFIEIFKKLDETKIYQTLSKKLPHVSCPVYSAVLKAIEVEADLALPKDALIKFKNTD